jgi:translation initiation factor IF-1
MTHQQHYIRHSSSAEDKQILYNPISEKMIKVRIHIPPKTKVLIQETDTALHDSKREKLT